MAGFSEKMRKLLKKQDDKEQQTKSVLAKLKGQKIQEMIPLQQFIAANAKQIIEEAKANNTLDDVKKTVKEIFIAAAQEHKLSRESLEACNKRGLISVKEYQEVMLATREKPGHIQN